MVKQNRIRKRGKIFGNGNMKFNSTMVRDNKDNVCMQTDRQTHTLSLSHTQEFERDNFASVKLKNISFKFYIK